MHDVIKGGYEIKEKRWKKKKGKPLIWLEEGEEEISLFLSHTYNDSKRRRERQRQRRIWGEKEREMRRRNDGKKK